MPAFSFPTVLNCSADFAIAGGSVRLIRTAFITVINNTVVFSTTTAAVSGSGMANFYNVATSTGVNLGSGFQRSTKTWSSTRRGFISVNTPFYGSSSTLIL
jgi:hypothetical protein